MNQTPTRKMCDAPEIGKFVSDYFFDMLSDSEALKVELHLVNCYSCKEHYHTVLRASAEMPALVNSPVPEETYPAPKGQFLARQKVKYARKASGSL
ncbi:MAG TPA: zf-HC2 domain-containing protein [Pyrinomonadaceae bacterium]